MVRGDGQEGRGYRSQSPCAQTALRGIENTEFFPAWGQARLQGMIANRPDWTLSRQRQWGVPMPFFLHRETGALHPRTPELLEKVAKRVEKGGIEAWQGVTAEELLGAEASNYEKSRDTLDVWFDSGSTHFTVLRGSHRDESRFPADLYLEGSDQHRGWFHSSLLVSCMLDGVPPYRGLLTHGFVIDGEGRKMSKSKGNVMAPQEISSRLGAEILRLWVASGDYSGELIISNEILKRVVESYRRMRNTLRFLLANTSDFDPAKHAVPVADMVEIDRYALAMTAQMQEEVTARLCALPVPPGRAEAAGFCSEDLGAFYLDILKDRLYTLRRRLAGAPLGADCALAHHAKPGAADGADPVLHRRGAWQEFARKTRTTACSSRPGTSCPIRRMARQLLAKWARLRELREPVTKGSRGTCGRKARSARPCRPRSTLAQPAADYELLARLGEDLRFLS